MIRIKFQSNSSYNWFIDDVNVMFEYLQINEYPLQRSVVMEDYVWDEEATALQSLIDSYGGRIEAF